MKENKRKTLLLSMFGKGMKREKRKEKKKIYFVWFVKGR